MLHIFTRDEPLDPSDYDSAFTAVGTDVGGKAHMYFDPSCISEKKAKEDGSFFKEYRAHGGRGGWFNRCTAGSTETRRSVRGWTRGARRAEFCRIKRSHRAGLDGVDNLYESGPKGSPFFAPPPVEEFMSKISSGFVVW